MRINTNVSAINAHKNLTQTQSAVGSSMQKLSSGFRINRAADDAAGLGIANALRATTRSLTQAARNAEQANSLLQIAEGGTGTIQRMLERMKELATQAASDTVDNAGRSQLQKEFDQLVDEIDRTINTTKFQGSKLLDGSISSFKFMVSSSGEYGGDDAVSVSLSNLGSAVLGATGSELSTLKSVAAGTSTPGSVFAADNLDAGGSNNAGSTGSAASTFVAASDNMDPDSGNTATGNVTLDGTYAGGADATLEVRQDSGALEYRVNGGSWTTVDQGGGETSFVHAGVTVETSGLVGAVDGDSWSVALEALVPSVPATTGNATATGTYAGGSDATISVRYSGGAFQHSLDGSTWTNFSGTSALVAGVTLDVSGISNQVNGDSWTIAATAEIPAGALTGGLLSVADAEGTLSSVDAAISQLADVLGDIGAAQNRIEYSLDNVRTSIQNFAAAESVIRDVDMAEEMTKFSKNNILAQAGTAMLAQANQSAQNVLQLLRG